MIFDKLNDYKEKQSTLKIECFNYLKTKEKTTQLRNRLLIILDDYLRFILIGNSLLMEVNNIINNVDFEILKFFTLEHSKEEIINYLNDVIKKYRYD